MKTKKTKTVKEPPTLSLIMGDGSTVDFYGDDFSALADALYEGRVEEPPFDWIVAGKGQGGGFKSGPYQGPVAHVGLFWGDSDGEMIRNLTRNERRAIERRVRKLFDEKRFTYDFEMDSFVAVEAGDVDPDTLETVAKETFKELVANGKFDIRFRGKARRETPGEYLRNK